MTSAHGTVHPACLTPPAVVHGRRTHHTYLQKCATLVAEQAKRDVRVDRVAQLHPAGGGQILGAGNRTDR